MNNVEYQVKNALATTLQFKTLDEIDNTHNLRKDLRLDSMSSIMFLMKLEENIAGFYVDPETLKNSDLETVSSVIRYVDRQVANATVH